MVIESDSGDSKIQLDDKTEVCGRLPHESINNKVILSKLLSVKVWRSY